MIYFGDGLKPNSEDIKNQIVTYRTFINLFKEKPEEVKELIFKLKKIYEHPTFSDKYRENQTNRLRNLSESLENTFVIGSSAIAEVKMIGDLNLDWCSLENIVKDYQCTFITETLRKYFENFYSSWINKVPSEENAEIKYTKSLEGHIKTSDNFKNFNSSLKGIKVKEFVDSLSPYSQELRINIDLLDMLYTVANDIEIKIHHSDLRENLEKIRDELLNNSNLLLNNRIVYLEEINKDFEKEFLDFLGAPYIRIKDEKIVKLGKEKDKIIDIRYPDSSLLTNKKIKKGIGLIKNKEYISAKKVFEEILSLNNKSSKAHFYIGLQNLRDSNNFAPKNKNLGYWHNFNLKKAINSFEKAVEFSVGESPEYQSKAYSLLAYAKLLQGKSTEEKLSDLINNALKISNNSLSTLVNAKIAIKHCFGDTKNKRRHLEDIIKSVEKIELSDIENEEFLGIFDRKDINYATAALIINTDEIKECNKEFAIELIDIEKKDALAYLYASKILIWHLLKDQKKAKSLSKKALIYVQKDLKKYKDSPKNIKFLLENKYKQYYYNYSEIMDNKKGHKVEDYLEEMKRTGIFKKLRWL